MLPGCFSVLDKEITHILQSNFDCFPQSLVLWKLLYTIVHTFSRTDLPIYKVFENGIEVKTVRDLLEYDEKMCDFVSFYMGCSFSFDPALLQAGVPLRCLGNVPAYVVRYTRTCLIERLKC